jgi:hypothetical protein
MLTTVPTGSHPSPSETKLPAHIAILPELDQAWRAPSAGERLMAVRRAAPRLRERILASGRVAAARTFDISPLPYPTRFAFNGAARSPVPFVIMTNRCNLVQLETSDGPKTLLFNPTDAARSAKTPYFTDLASAFGATLTRAMEARFRRPTAAESVFHLGVRPEDVDYIAFDHLHTQDLRGLLGTRDTPAAFPNARLLVQRAELAILTSLHPFQRPWFIPDAIDDVDPARFLITDADLLVGPGAALVRTPGHTAGNWSLVLNTDRGVWAVSENGVACDSYAPEASSIGGLSRFAARHGVEVILNANTLEGRNEQYTSMILEKALVDRCPASPAFYQHLSSSELTSSLFAPGLGPTYAHGGLNSGSVRRSAA